MKFMIASDLHGSLYYGQKVKEWFEKEQPEKLILLGDLLYHGARNDLPRDYDTKGLTQVLNSMKEHILAVRGNCDSEVDQMVLEFPMMADYLMMYVDGRPWLVTHGHVFDEDHMIPHTADTVLLHGHTHLKITERREDFWYINPGSTSIPKDDERHSFMIYEDGTFTIRDLEDGSVLKTYSLQ